MGKAAKAAKQRWREKRTKDLEEMLDYTGYRHKWYTEYQVRVWAYNKVYDFYPTNGRYHNLEEKFYGDYNTIEDVFKILSE